MPVKNALRAALTDQIARTVVPVLKYVEKPLTLAEVRDYTRDTYYLLRRATPRGTALHSVLCQAQTHAEAYRKVQKAWHADNELRKQA
jgi:hypothetical protein